MSSLFAFPGQGAQQVGMLRRLPDGAGQLLEEASDTLGQQALALDSQQALQTTRAVQLCLLLAGVAWARWLMQRSPAPDYVAGLSIGAYPAAVTAGAAAASEPSPAEPIAIAGARVIVFSRKSLRVLPVFCSDMTLPSRTSTGG